MTEDSLLPFDLPAVSRKKVTADFAGGSISSDGGLVLLRAAERRLGLAEALAGCIREWRDPERVVHTLPAMLRFRMFAIACGYEDADDCDALRGDPLFKLAVGRAPESGRDLCSQPTMSRLENAPSRSEVARMTAVLVDIFCRSFPSPPAAITLDIDDTCDAVHGQQQLSLFNAFYDTRCFLPVHVYHVESGKPVAVLLRPGKTPSGAEVRILLKHLVRRIRRHWPRTRLTFRGDSHYGRTEAMAWCEENGVDYIFGLAGNPVLHRFAYGVADDLKVRHAEAGAEKMRGFASFDYAAGSQRRVVPGWRPRARLRRPLHRHLFSMKISGEPGHLIKLHKGQLASDRTSCQSPIGGGPGKSGRSLRCIPPCDGGMQMISKRRKFSGELKAKIALEALRGDRTLQEIASKHQVHPNQVGAWKRQAIEGLAEVFSNGVERHRRDNESEVRELHAKIGELIVERDFLSRGPGR